ncbi:hypothetical protein PENARI_c018G07472 [Penicillium arizonense]|uniref:Uncharacterized protein n=1 Tax=Penicillium arizonense TaxID=1835702 RepID=A0A1F5LA12_PENAI|nr:hypothetical protein PENARI_c018G07472 [Penicillium arizonense]
MAARDIRDSLVNLMEMTVQSWTES